MKSINGRIRLLAIAMGFTVATAGVAAPRGGVPLGDVTVVNPSAMPVPVAPGGMPVVATNRSDCGSNSCSTEVYSVPDGKLLIIEFVSTRADGADLDDEFRWAIDVNMDGRFHDFDLGLLEKQPPLGANSQHSAGEQVRILAGPGSVFVRVGYGNFGAISFIRASISGWLIDMP